MKEFTVSEKEAGMRLLKYLNHLMPEAGNGFFYKMLRKKNIKRNDAKAEGSDVLCEGDRIRIFFSDETFEKMGLRQSSAEQGEHVRVSEYERAYRELRGIEVVFECRDCVIFYKPAGILSQKAKPEDLSLNEYLIGYLLTEKKIREEELALFRPSVLNRLDRNTRGLVIGSKTLKGAREISKALKDRTLGKHYKAVLYGKIPEVLSLTGYLRKDEETNIVKVFDTLPEDPAGCFRIETVVAPISFGEDSTVADIELVTGKSHQIRAQLAHIGHPVLGDTKYGYMKFNRAHQTFTQELCAYKLTFPKDFPIEECRGREVTIETGTGNI